MTSDRTSDRTSGAGGGQAGSAGIGSGGLEPPVTSPNVVLDTIPGMIRAVRRLADLSQRELACAAKVSRSTVARLESGALAPSLGLLLRLLGVARLTLVVTTEDGHVIQPMRAWDDTRDGAGRQFPAHLDLILDPRGGEWWADVYGLARPPETFWRNRRYRDAKRRRSQWEVRVQRFRGVPPPPDPDVRRYW